MVVEAGAGAGANYSDADYAAAGATIAPDGVALKNADIVLKVRGPDAAEIAQLKRGAILAALLAPATEQETIGKLAEAGVDAFAMEFLPRISRAQAMDVLSSQANLAGYKAVIDAAAEFGRAMPMMMTAAGTIAPARVLVMGVGVAGLQAIATAKRLGAIVSATDVRPATKEQVESLGGTFVAVIDDEFKNAQTAAGYAKEMSKEYQAKQAALIAETIKKQDIVITTALIPGRKAPVLVTRRDGQDHEAGLGDRRSRRRAGRQLPAHQGQRGDQGPWRHHHGPHQSARARSRSMRRPSMRATCSISSACSSTRRPARRSSTGTTRSSKARA